MNRRQFLLATGHGMGALGLASTAGCKIPGSGEASGDLSAAVDHVAGSEHRVFDTGGGVFALDPESHRIHAVGAGARSALVESTGDSGGDEGELNFPLDADVGPDGRLYVLDHGHHRIQVFESDGRPVRVIGEDALFHPQDFLLHDGRLYVCDTHGHEVHVFDLDGREVLRFGGFGTEGAELNGPCSIAVAGDGDLHVLELGDAGVQVFSPQGEPRHRYGGYDRARQILRPRSIAALGDGRMCLADPFSGLVHVFAEDGSALGSFRPVDSGGNPVTPVRLRTMPDGRLYVWTAGHVPSDA